MSIRPNFPVSLQNLDTKITNDETTQVSTESWDAVSVGIQSK